VARLGERDRDGHILVAFDFGLRRIGVATANLETRTASPLTTVRVDRDPPWRELDRIIDDWRPAQLVVGVPEGDGAASIARQARAFAAALGERYGLPVATVDETLSSPAAESDLAEGLSKTIAECKTKNMSQEAMRCLNGAKATADFAACK
jgi:putative Holliday junction resolvase